MRVGFGLVLFGGNGKAFLNVLKIDNSSLDVSLSSLLINIKPPQYQKIIFKVVWDTSILWRTSYRNNKIKQWFKAQTTNLYVVSSNPAVLSFPKMFKTFCFWSNVKVLKAF